MFTKQLKKPLLLLTALCIGHSSIHATPPQDDLTISRPGQLLRLWFSPKHGWRARSYDQRYPGCTRQQIYRVYTADAVGLPSMLRHPNHLHFLPDPDESDREALYVGQLGLAGGMPSKRGIEKSTKNLKQIVQEASKQGKMGDLRRALSEAQASDDFDNVYEQVFGPGSDEVEDLYIFGLKVSEVQGLPAYKEIVFPPALDVESPKFPDGTLARRALEVSVKDLKEIVGKASDQDRMGSLQRALARARQDEDFSDVYDEVFGEGSSEQEGAKHLTIFDLNVGEVRGLANYHEVVFPVADDQKQESDEEDDGDSVRPQYGHDMPSSAGQAMGPEGLIKHLQERYEQDNELPPLLDDKPQSMESYYVRLVMRTIEETRQRHKQAKKQPREDLEQKAPDEKQPDQELVSPGEEEWEASLDHKLLYEVKKPIELKKLWERDLGVVKDKEKSSEEKSGSEAEAEKSEPTKAPRHCCILGQAGSGKTTMTRYITYQWSKGALWKDRFDWIMCLPLRWVHTLRDKESMPELLARQWGCHVADVELLLEQPKGLIILDGWDEVIELVKEDHPLQPFLEKYSSQESISWLTTSRPYASLPMHIGVDRQCDLIGFQKEDVATYVNKYFEKDSNSGQELLKRLEDLPELRLLSQVPLYTRFLCLLKRRSPELFAKGERLSIAYLYHKLVRSFLRYSLSKRYGECTSLYAYLGELAFRSLSERQVLISSELQNDVESNIEAAYKADIHTPSYRDQALDTGLLQALGEGATPVHFPHLSLQEWFAAYHISQSLYAPAHDEVHKRACEVLQQRKYDVRYRQVLPLTAGLLYRKYMDGEDHEAYGLRLFWRYVLSDPQELVGIHQVVLNMRCMEACGADTKGALLKLHKPILDDITSWVLAAWGVRAKLGLTPALLPVLEEVWPTCPCVLSYKTLAEGVLRKLKGWKKLPQLSEKAALGTLRTLERLANAAWPLTVQEALWDYVLTGCKHISEDIRQAVERQLSQVLEGVYSKEAWQDRAKVLIDFCKDRHWEVRYGVAINLSKRLEDAYSGEAWKGIAEVFISLCKDDCQWVREAVAFGLSKVLERACSEEGWKGIVEALTGLCKDRDDGVREVAACGLSEGLGKKCLEEAWKAIVQTLKSVCEDEDYGVRYAAAEGLSKALGSACSEESWKGILEDLKGLCKDEHVRKAASEGLSKALEGVSEQAWKGRVEVLASFCKDDHVRQAAAESLSKALEGVSEEAWQGRLEVLTDLCKDEDWRVRHAAQGSLSKSLESGCSGEAWKGRVEALTGLCRDQHWEVRYAAAVGLSKGLESTYSEEGWKSVAQALTSLAKDGSEWVREAATFGLSKVLEKVCSQEDWEVTVEALTDRCKDEGASVREVAAFGLSESLEGAYSEEAWKGIVATLTSFCKDEDDSVREAGAFGLSKALEGACSEEAWKSRVEVLTGLCEDDSEWVREAASEGLSKGLARCSGQARASMVASFRVLCQDKSEYVRKTAVSALSRALEAGCSEASWQAIITSFRGLCQDSNRDVCWAASEGLSKALEGTCSEEGWRGRLDVFRDLCQDSNQDVRWAGAFGLSKALDPPCSETSWQAIVTSLRGLCQDWHSHVRWAAACGLSKALKRQCSEASSKPLLESLKELCRGSNSDVRMAVVRGLSQVLEGRYAKENCKAILKFLKSLCQDRNRDVRIAAAEGLSQALKGGSQTSCRSILETIGGLCDDRDRDVRMAAAGALSKGLEERCSESNFDTILEALRGLSRDKDEDVRSAADQALVQAMHKKKLLMRVLMASMRKKSQALDCFSCSPGLAKAIATYNPCLVLPATCGAEVSRRIKHCLDEQRRVRSWPVQCEALRILRRDLPPRPAILVYSGLSQKEVVKPLEQLGRSESTMPEQQTA